MGWKDLFKKKKSPDPDPLHDLTLHALKVGYLVDYDLRTWEVKAFYSYEWSEGDVSIEWQLVSSDETMYLELEKNDEDYWSVNRPIPFARLGPDIRNHILEHGDPPNEIVFEGVAYYLDEMAGGYFHEGDKASSKELLRWSYEDDSGEKLLTIEQWGEAEFEASIGEPVEAYRFTNILPGKSG